ncbi:MAG: phosphatidylserine decarboxylase, partial [Campylobacterales bacterium]
HVASKRFPRAIQENINRLYIRLFKIDMRRFEEGPFASLNALFTRRLKEPPVIDSDPEAIVSPCDAKIVGVGKIEDGEVYQIKLMTYSLRALLLDLDVRPYEGGEFINLYLSPKDYHRYHAPLTMRIGEAYHIPGKLYPVHLKALKTIKNLYIENERVVLRCFDERGREFVMVFVGALNVGKMLFHFDERITTNHHPSEPTHYTYENLWINKGDELGMFMMGSTILLFFSEGMSQLVCSETRDVIVGQRLGTLT